MIRAHSSQAKGRVERAKKTVQDRLIKEMRLHGISNIQDTNAFVPQFLEGYNKRFAVPAKRPEDAHRKLLQAPEELKRILSCHTNRKLSKNLEFSLNRRIYQITTPGKGYRLRGKTIMIYEHADGSEEVLSGLTNLPFKVLSTISKGSIYGGYEGLKFIDGLDNAGRIRPKSKLETGHL